MPPTSSRDFQLAAMQRFTTAEFLLLHKRTLDAYYLGGYTIECALKALILEKTLLGEKQNQLVRICSGAKMHRPEVLLGILKDLDVALPLQLARRFRRIAWSTDLRYETGLKDTGETRAFLRTAHETLVWVERQLP